MRELAPGRALRMILKRPVATVVQPSAGLRVLPGKSKKC